MAGICVFVFLLSLSGVWDLSWPVYVFFSFESFGSLGFELAGICGAYLYLLFVFFSCPREPYPREPCPREPFLFLSHWESVI